VTEAYTLDVALKSLEALQFSFNSFSISFTADQEVPMSNQAEHTYAFGPFSLNAEERLLLRDGVAVALTAKAFDTLLMLAQNTGHMLEKDELLKKVWPDTFVEEATLAQNIFLIRKALGDDHNGNKYIETIPKHGYRFVATVREVDATVAPIVQAESESPEILESVSAARASQTRGLSRSGKFSRRVTEIETILATLRTRPLVGVIQHHKKNASVAIGAIIIAVAVVVFGLSKFIGQDLFSFRGSPGLPTRKEPERTTAKSGRDTGSPNPRELY
jgi:DNA-binding winged helix-turn-helix (wHTH) protein